MANQDAQAQPTSSADISTMKMAVLSGDPRRVEALIGTMVPEEALEALSTTYGGAEGSYLDADEDDLFSWTSPVLHAARSGNLAIFESVVAVIWKLSPDQRHDMLTKEDMKGLSLLALAARSGSKDVVQRVLLVMREMKLPEEKVRRMLLGKNREGCSLVAIAARSGSTDVVEEVLRVLEQASSKDKVQEMLLEKDWFDRSVLAFAARSGSKGVVERVLWHLNQNDSEKVQGMLAEKDINGHSLLAMAVRSGSKEVVEQVLLILRRELSERKVKGMLQSIDIYGAPLLDRAVSSGNRDTFNALLSIITDELTEHEVRQMLAYKNRMEGSLLTRAASTGNSEIFEAVLNAVRDRLPNKEVKLIFIPRDKLCRSLLESAVNSREAEKFKAAMTTVSNILTEEEVKEILRPKVDTGSFIARAAGTGKNDMFDAVLTACKERLPDQVKMIMSFEDKYNKSLVASAVGSKSGEMFRVAMAAVSDDSSNLNEEEVKHLISSQGQGECSLLFWAVRSGSADMFRKVLDVVSTKLSDEEMKNELMDKDTHKRSLLSEAAISENKGLFDAVLATVKKRLSDDQAKEIVSSRDEDEDTLISFAVGSKSERMFRAALAAVSDVGGDAEMKEQLKAKGEYTGSLVTDAAFSGTTGLFKAVLNAVRENLPQEMVKRMILSRDGYHCTLLSRAVRSHSAEMFKMAMDMEELTKDEVNSMLRGKGSAGTSLLADAAINSMRGVDLFDVVLETVQENLSKEQVKQMIHSLDKGGRSLLAYAAASLNVDVFEKANKVFSHDLLQQQTRDQVRDRRRRKTADPTNSYSNPITPVGEAIGYGDLGVSCIALRSADKNLMDQKVQDALDASFISWADRYQLDRSRNNARKIGRCKRILCMIFKHKARPPKQFLQRISHDVTDGEEGLWQIFTERVLSELECARNPLIPGMNVSVALSEAAKGAREGEQRILLSFQKKVDNYVLKVLEWLPQTVRGFNGGMRQWSALFEPEGPRNNLRERPGPLRVAFERRHHTKILCAVPLVMDYLSQKFTKGLPSMRDSGHVLQNRAELIRLAEGEDGDSGLVLGVQPGDAFFDFDHIDDQQDLHPSGNDLEHHPYGDFKDSGFFRVWLQGANASRPSLTFLPGLQFIVAGILAKPNSYYDVPAMRMVLDFAVYIIMLWAYSEWVLLHEDGPLTVGEIAFAIYSLGAILRELREMARGGGVYLQDRWNVLDVLSLVILGAGFFYRLADSGGPWGRALYALSAPLVFSRLLFYAQFLPFQGSMVEVIFSMVIVIAQFGVVLLIIMAGFAMSLFPLLRSAGNFTFDDTLLLLFKTLLGDVEAFEEFDESAENRYGFIGRLLLAVYLVVMTIMLLNLLVAVLSTAHAKVEMNTDKGIEVSKVRIVEHYRLIVALDILPAPFNLVQFIVTLPFFLTGQLQSELCQWVLRAVGCVSFWLALSPLAVAAGISLWVASSIYSISVPSRELVRSAPVALMKSWALYRHILVFSFYALGAPSCLLFLWVWEPCMLILGLVGYGGRSTQSNHAKEKEVEANVHSMLEASGVGANDLHNCLRGPLIDSKVRPQEVERSTTDDHMEYLRNRLEKIFNERIYRLEKKLMDRANATTNPIDEEQLSADKVIKSSSLF